MGQEHEKEEGARSFTAFLRSVDGGSFEAELAEELYKLNGTLAQIASQSDPAAAGEGAKDFATRLGVEFAPPQRLMEVSRNLSIRVTDKVTQAVTLQSGEVQLAFSSQHSDEAGQPVKVPAAFLLGLPIFKNGEAFQVCARLRYRVKDGSVTWWYELHRADRAFDVAVEDAAKQAAEQTGLPLFFGTPEA